MLDPTTAKLNAEFMAYIKQRVEPKEWQAKNYNGLAMLLNFCWEFIEREKITEASELMRVMAYMFAVQANLRQGQTARAIQYWLEANAYNLEIEVNKKFLLNQMKKQSRNFNF